MKKYTVKASYIVKKELEVEVPDGEDPNVPSNWDIKSEHDTDCFLHDTDSIKEGWE